MKAATDKQHLIKGIAEAETPSYDVPHCGNERSIVFRSFSSTRDEDAKKAGELMMNRLLATIVRPVRHRADRR